LLKKRAINIALLGIGTIGSGVVRALLLKAKTLTRQAGSPLALKLVVEKDIARHGSQGLEKSIFTIDYLRSITEKLYSAVMLI